MYNLKDILDRLKSHYRCKNFKEIANIIGVKYQTLTTWLQRNKIPFELLHKIAQNENISFDWLLTGKGSMYLNDLQKENSITVSNIGNNIKGNTSININIQTHKKDVTQKEDELIEAYRALPATLQDYYYHRIQADALEIKLKNQQESKTDE